MTPKRDPLANPERSIRRVYAYVAYRVGDGPDAEDITSEVFERALRYRDSFDESRGEPLAWLVGIARRCVNDALQRHGVVMQGEDPQVASPEDVESETVERLTLAAAIARLDDRSRELLALRFGADLSARQIGKILGLKTNAVEVALHRAVARLRADLGADDAFGAVQVREAAPHLLP
jgi:RNA polymerase sigma-70 factor, ECF subfamily